MPLLSVVMSVYGGGWRTEILKRTLDSIFKQEFDCEAVIVLDGFDQPTLELLQSYPKVRYASRLKRLRPTGFCNPCIPHNMGIRMAQGELVLLQSVENVHVSPDSLKILAERTLSASNLTVFGSVAALNQDGSLKVWYCHPTHNRRPLHFCQMVRRSHLLEIRGYDEDYYLGYGYDDDDLSHRLSKLGVGLEFRDDVVLHHHWHEPTDVGVPSNEDLFRRKCAESFVVRNLGRDWGVDWDGVEQQTVQVEPPGPFDTKQDKLPVFINNFNRLTSTKMLVQWLSRIPYVRPIILDNSSTYPPLLRWYQEGTVEVLHLGQNMGHLALWMKSKTAVEAQIPHQYSGDWYAYTDSDIMPSEMCPLDLFKQLKQVMEKDPALLKAGISLEINDLPSCYSLRQEVKNWERGNWQKKHSEGFFEAGVDTTLALYHKGRCSGFRQDFPSPGGIIGTTPAVRSDRPYVARHLPWYIDSSFLGEEERYYVEHAGASSSWAARIGGVVAVEELRPPGSVSDGLRDFVQLLPTGATVVEVGCYAGAATEIFLEKAALVICVDPWKDYADVGCMGEPRWVGGLREAESVFDKLLKKYPGRIIKVKAPSAVAASFFANESVDTVYLDGLHTFEGAKLDIISWLPKIKKAGCISGHDFEDYHRACTLGMVAVREAVVSVLGYPDALFSDNTWATGLDRKIIFDESYYLEQNPDVAAAISAGEHGGLGLNHYYHLGRADVRKVRFLWGKERGPVGKKVDPS